jgi:hypothetical protein
MTWRALSISLYRELLVVHLEVQTLHADLVWEDDLKRRCAQ